MEIKIQNIDTIRESAREFIQNIGEHKVFAFYGKMGAGKTTFVKAICEELGVEDVITSPTFAIGNEYRGGKTDVAHFDVYRIGSEEELYGTGFYDYLDGRWILFIEWSENIPFAVTDDMARVAIEKTGDGGRRITMEVPGEAES